MSDQNGSSYLTFSQQKHTFNKAISYAFVAAYVDLHSQHTFSPHGISPFQEQSTSTGRSFIFSRNGHHSSSDPSTPMFTMAYPYQVMVDECYLSAIYRIYQDISTHHQQSLIALRELLEPLSQAQHSDSRSGISYEAYERVLQKVFEKQISWGRIIMMFTFTGMLTAKSLTLEGGNLVDDEAIRDFRITVYSDWATNYMEKYLIKWIEENGGWQGLLTYEADHPGSQLLSEITGSLVVAGGLLLLGGLAAYLFARGSH